MKKFFSFILSALLLTLMPFSAFAESDFEPYWFPEDENHLTACQQDYFNTNYDSIKSASFVFSYLDTNEFAWGFVSGNGPGNTYFRMDRNCGWINRSDWKPSLPSDANNRGAIYQDKANYLGQGVINNLDVLVQKDKFTVSLFSSPSVGGSVTGGGTFEEGTSVTVYASPYKEYRFIGWYENNKLVSSSSTFTFTLTSNRNKSLFGLK